MGHAVHYDQLDARAWLEMQVAALADGTIDPVDQPMVEAAVLSDPSLQALLSDLRRVDALLGRSPDLGRIDFAGLARTVMTAVRADLAGGQSLSAPLTLSPVPASSPAEAVSAARWTLARTIRWSGVAAALVVGAGVGAILLQNNQPAAPSIPAGTAARPSLLVELGNQTAGVDPTRTDAAASDFAVVGPGGAGDALAPSARPAGAPAVANSSLNVTGPDVAASLDPKVHSNFPDYAGAGDARRAAVAPGNATAVADANRAE